MYNDFTYKLYLTCIYNFICKSYIFIHAVCVQCVQSELLTGLFGHCAYLDSWTYLPYLSLEMFACTLHPGAAGSSHVPADPRPVCAGVHGGVRGPA